MDNNLIYKAFLQEVKQTIIHSRYQAARLANREQILLYYWIGHQLDEKITTQAWGAKVMDQMAADLQQELPGLRGFSARNLKNMRQFYTAYAADSAAFGFGQPATAQLPAGKRETIGQSATAQIQDYFFSISFTHHILLLNKCKDQEERNFYIKQSATLFWTVTTLEHHIKSNLYGTVGKLPNNFDTTLPGPLKARALEIFKDSYLLDFLPGDDVDDERLLEAEIVSNIKNFIMSLGTGFSFIGNQYRLEVAEVEYFVDLLFYNRSLQCLVAIELKRGKFRPEYAGQLNFYLNVLDDTVRLPHENMSIGIILCKEKDNTTVEYSFRNINKPMGVSTFGKDHQLTKQLPEGLKKILPDPEALKKLL